MAGIVVIVLLIDQITKHLMTTWLGPDASQHRVDLVGQFVAFEYVRNTGVAFGMLPGRQWLVSTLAIVVLAGFLVVFWKALPGNRTLQCGVALVSGGAIGNLIDRTRLGYVVDFMAVGTWPRFNIADSAVTIGLGLLIWVLMTQPEDKPNTGGRDSAEGQHLENH